MRRKELLRRFLRWTPWGEASGAAQKAINKQGVMDEPGLSLAGPGRDGVPTYGW